MIERNLRKYLPAFVTGCLGIWLAMNMSVANAGVSTIYPGAGNNPPKTPDWNVKNQEGGSGTVANKAGKSIKKLDKSKRTAATMLSVMLGEGLASATVSANGDYELLDGNEGKILQKMSSNATAELKINGGAMYLNGKKIASKIITLRTGEGNQVVYNDTSYRGQLRLVYDGSSIKVLNIVSLEDYAKGVLPSEMSPSWQPEALKAQAVAARTFALYNRGKGHNASSGYDLCSSSHCQVYSGSGAETNVTNQAVDDTYGQIMQYDNLPIYAAFHASSGGATENSEDVWGTYLPYLRSVTDDDSKSPYHNWITKYTVDQVRKKLSSAGKDVGDLQSIALVPMTGSGSVTGRSASGRAYGVKFTGTNGNITITGEQARSIFGLKSAMFNVRTERSAQISDKGQKKAGASDNTKVDAKPAAMNNGAMRLQGVDSVVFEGHGFGHGLGLAQYGANAMAAAGSSYDAILHHYYTNVVIQEIY